MTAPLPYPALSRLCTTYLHPGLSTESDGWRGAVRRFLADEPLALVQQARSEAAGLVHRGLSEKDLTRLFETLGSRYWPPVEGVSFVIWLRELHGTLQETPAPGVS